MYATLSLVQWLSADTSCSNAANRFCRSAAMRAKRGDAGVPELGGEGDIQPSLDHLIGMVFYKNKTYIKDKKTSPL